jgi:hypothetical protein
MFFPSTYPISRSPCWNAATRAATAAGLVPARNAIRGFFVGCCASIGTLSPKSKVLRTELVICFFMFLVMPVAYWLFNHFITLSARASTAGGIVSPICFAAFRLIISSNLVGCSTGRAAGFVPFRILST